MNLITRACSTKTRSNEGFLFRINFKFPSRNEAIGKVWKIQKTNPRVHVITI